MPRKTREAIKEWNDEYYRINGEKLRQERRERYATDDEFRERIAGYNRRWYFKNDVCEKRRIHIPEYMRICNTMTEPEPFTPPHRKTKSSLQLKRERIQRQLDKTEERARLFRLYLISQQSISDGTTQKNADEPTTNLST